MINNLITIPQVREFDCLFSNEQFGLFEIYIFIMYQIYYLFLTQFFKHTLSSNYLYKGSAVRIYAPVNLQGG